MSEARRDLCVRVCVCLCVCVGVCVGVSVCACVASPGSCCFSRPAAVHFAQRPEPGMGKAPKLMAYGAHFEAPRLMAHGAHFKAPRLMAHGAHLARSRRSRRSRGPTNACHPRAPLGSMSHTSNQSAAYSVSMLCRAPLAVGSYSSASPPVIVSVRPP